METFKTEYKHSIVLKGKGKDRTLTTYLTGRKHAVLS